MAKKFWDRAKLETYCRLYSSSSGEHEAMSRIEKELGRATPRRAVLVPLSQYGMTPPKLGSRKEGPSSERKEDGKDYARLQMMERAIEEISKREPQIWRRGASKKKIFHGAPTLFLSDLHHGEVVDKLEVDGANEFDMAISARRIRTVAENGIYLLDNAFASADYPFVVIPLGGDMVSGNIHEELRETNDVPIFDIVLDLADLLSSVIATYADRFGEVFVPCVVGNHGRIDKKPRAKRAPKDNYEYMLYMILAQRFAKDKRVHIKVSDSLTLTYSVFGTRYLLTHGDMFRGGGGIAGPFTPWALGDHRIRKQRAGISQWTGVDHSHDVTIFGHWHQYFPSRTFVANGSLKGFDEYSKRSGFGFEPPQQAMWLTSPEYGMTFHVPVFGEASVRR